jgi:ubiquinone/menaquinone biosynthesis C-methylase UbiE
MKAESRTVLSLVAALTLFLSSCSPKALPYENGPAMGQKDIRKVFQPILNFMEYKPGMAFADVGAGSGALTVMMAVLMSSSKVYIQDIDTNVLTPGNVDKIIDYYSHQAGLNLRSVNQYEIAIGGLFKTNLPDSTFDFIYSNGTVHNFASLDSIAVDLRKKLKPGGVVYFRDSFKGDHGEGEFCSDPKCARPLKAIDEFLTVMKRNGFKVLKQSPDMSGYPVFGFAADEVNRP